MAHNHEHDENCCCGHDEELGRMSLILEDDKEVLCDVLGIFSLSEEDETEYIALLPDDSEDVLLYRYYESDDGVELANIEEFEEVADCFDELFTEEFDEDSEELEAEEELEKLEK